MEHEPVAGQVLLAPPDAAESRRYLTQAEAIVERRERVVDRRAAAWLAIVNAGIIAGYLCVLTLGVRQSIPSVGFQALLIPILLWAQISAGISARGDRGPRTSSRWLVTLGGAAVLVAALVFFAVILVDDAISPRWMTLPIALVLLGFGGYGVVRLIRAARGPRPLPAVRAALTPGVRAGTVLVGVALGSVCALSAVPDVTLRSVLLFLGLLALIAWFAASGTVIGLPLVGASWRWPHLLVLAISVGVLLVLRVPVLDGAIVAPATFLLAGLGIVAMFVMVSAVPGRDLDA